MFHRVMGAGIIVLAAACAGYPSGPPDRGVLPERITVLSVDASVVEGDTGTSDVLLTFRARNDGAHKAHRVSMHVEAFQGDVQVGSASSHDNPSVRKGCEAVIRVRFDNPNTLEEFDCFEYEVEALIDGYLGIAAPVRNCL